MSSNSECQFVEIKPSQWYYILEDYSAPKNAWDWREYASAFGPFDAKDKADQHLQDNHSNPGGSCILPLEDGQTEVNLEEDKILKALIDTATKPDTGRSFGFGW